MNLPSIKLPLKNLVIAILLLLNIGQGAVIFMNKDVVGTGGVTSAESPRIITRNFTGEVVATADGREVKEQEVRERLNFITGGRGDQIDLAKMDKTGLEAVAREAAVQRKVLEEAYAAGIQNDVELQNRIDDLVENIYKEKYLEGIAKSGITDDKMKQLYDELVSKAKSSKQYKVSHILVRTEAEAKDVLNKIKTQKFADVAKAVSVDKQSAARGGDLGYIFPEEFVVEFSDAVKKLGKGQTSAPVKTEFGWHIIKVEDSKNAEIIPFEEAKPRIEKQLGSESVKNYIEDLSKKIVIEVVKAPSENPAPQALAPDVNNPATGAPAGGAASPLAPSADVAPSAAAPTVAPKADEGPSLNPDEVKN